MILIALIFSIPGKSHLSMRRTQSFIDRTSIPTRESHAKSSSERATQKEGFKRDNTRFKNYLELKDREHAQNFRNLIISQFLLIPHRIAVPRDYLNTFKDNFKSELEFNTFISTLSVIYPLNPIKSWTQSHEIVLASLKSKVISLNIKMDPVESILVVWKLQSHPEYSHLFKQSIARKPKDSFNLYDRLYANTRESQLDALNQSMINAAKDRRPMSIEKQQELLNDLNAKKSINEAENKRVVQKMKFDYYLNRFKSEVDIIVSLKERDVMISLMRNMLNPIKEMTDLTKFNSLFPNYTKDGLWTNYHEQVYKEILNITKDRKFSFQFAKAIELPSNATPLSNLTSKDKLEQINYFTKYYKYKTSTKKPLDTIIE